MVYAEHITSNTVTYILECSSPKFINSEEDQIKKHTAENRTKQTESNTQEIAMNVDGKDIEEDEKDREEEVPSRHMKHWTTCARKMFQPLSLVCKEVYADFNE